MCVQALISIREYTGEHRSVGDEALPVLLLNNVCVKQSSRGLRQLVRQPGSEMCSPSRISARVCRVCCQLSLPGVAEHLQGRTTCAPAPAFPCLLQHTCFGAEGILAAAHPGCPQTPPPSATSRLWAFSVSTWCFARVRVQHHLLCLVNSNPSPSSATK